MPLDTPATRVSTEDGMVEGAQVEGLHVFRNIPYAQAPFGPLRFRPPVRPEPWDGVRDATRPGPAAPQPPEGGPLGALYSPAVTGEDCLTLEVWTPDPGAAGLPVMVHIHGGGFVFGAGSLPGYSGRTFARDGVVHVGINYRLGVEGFLYLGEGADNLGLRDQTAALEWVQRNVAAFGGDPGRVTIFGQSGGAVSVMLHLAMPASRGLFARAIAQSGCSVPSVDAEEAMQVTRQVARKLGVAPTVEGLSSAPLEKTVPATYKALVRFGFGLVLGDPRSLLISPFRAVHGTEVLPLSPLDAAPSQTVPLLAGTTSNELVDMIEAFIAAIPGFGRFVRQGLRRALKLDKTLIRAYTQGPRRISGSSELVEAAWSDWGFRIPTIRLMEARTEPSWLYEFRWQAETRAPGFGSAHGIDLPFVRDDLETVLALGEPARATFGSAPPAQLAAAMHAAFVNFATTGDPGWAPYDTKDRATMVFDTVSEVQPDAAGVERQAWTGRR
jgi:para-nitrobenzyl esterase